MNRDDDLDGGAAMHELASWTDGKKFEKLKKVVDPFAKGLLSKCLSHNPDDRPKSMEEVLQDDFFQYSKKDEGDLKKIEKLLNEKADEDRAAFARLEAGQNKRGFYYARM